MLLYRVLVIFLIFFCSCNEINLVEDLSQKEAKEIFSKLSESGLSPSISKTSGSRPTYLVNVKKSDYTVAISLLQKNNLPREKKESFEDLIKPKGFLPNSQEFENLRLNRAVATSIEEALLTDSRVEDVYVIVSGFSNNGLFQRQRIVNNRKDGRRSSSSSMSVALKLKDRNTFTKEELFKFISNIIPNLKIENLSLITSNQIATIPNQIKERIGLGSNSTSLATVPLVPFLFWYIPADDHENFAYSILVVVLASLLGGMLFGYYYAFYTRFRKKVSHEKNYNTSLSSGKIISGVKNNVELR